MLSIVASTDLATHSDISRRSSYGCYKRCSGSTGSVTLRAVCNNLLLGALLKAATH